MTKNDFKELYELYKKNGENITHTAKEWCKIKNIEYSDSKRRKASIILASVTEKNVSDNILGNETETNQYATKEVSHKNFTAIGDDGNLMPIDKYCEYYNLDLNKIRSYKLISHTGVPFYNCVFYEEVLEPSVTDEEFKNIIKEGLESIKYKPLISKNKEGKTGVVKIADLHLGAYVDNLIKTKQFSIDILANKLLEAVDDINERDYSTVHVHILGDLIESFTGLSHKNTWKGLDKAMVGAEAVKLVVKILHDNFLSKIKNLSDIKVVAGNHDRVTSDNKEDVQGGAASLVCWGLELLGYSVEFNPLVITHTIGNITHILTHGHHALSKKSTKQLCWDYGVQGNYNLICEGHLHSIIQKLNINQRDTYQTIKDDAVDHRRMNCPSFFTGNFFSESLGYTSESGFVIVEDNGKGVPNVFYYAI
jgi:predicted phosphodiesterase